MAEKSVSAPPPTTSGLYSELGQRSHWTSPSFGRFEGWVPFHNTIVMGRYSFNQGIVIFA
jgi:hypothetical protein